VTFRIMLLGMNESKNHYKMHLSIAAMSYNSFYIYWHLHSMGEIARLPSQSHKGQVIAGGRSGTMGLFLLVMIGP